MFVFGPPTHTHLLCVLLKGCGRDVPCTVMFWCLWRHCYCIRSGLHVCVMFVSSPPHPLLLSVPAGSKGGASPAALQRSRSDVDVNAAAVAKHRHVGQPVGTGRLNPGSYSSLGKGPVNQARQPIRLGCNHACLQSRKSTGSLTLIGRKTKTNQYLESFT